LSLDDALGAGSACDVTGRISKIGDGGVRTALYEARRETPRPRHFDQAAGSRAVGDNQNIQRRREENLSDASVRERSPMLGLFEIAP